MRVKTVTINAHARDCQDWEFYDVDGRSIKSHVGYSPITIPEISAEYGDDVSFKIDNETGRIIGWVPITDEQLEEMEVDEE